MSESEDNYVPLFGMFSKPPLKPNRYNISIFIIVQILLLYATAITPSGFYNITNTNPLLCIFQVIAILLLIPITMILFVIGLTSEYIQHPASSSSYGVNPVTLIFSLLVALFLLFIWYYIISITIDKIIKFKNKRKTD